MSEFLSPKIAGLEGMISVHIAAKEAAVRRQDYDQACVHRDEIQRLKRERDVEILRHRQG